ncbi:MAG: glycosyltransferase family 9 protein [Ignavibacteria bacterium]|nr:glycosyltransferase family 9 protein [Ignavibacteria bacterium]
MNPEFISDLKIEEIKSILIVRQHNQLGDLLCSLPLFWAIRKKFSDSFIVLVASPENYEVVSGEIKTEKEQKSDYLFDEILVYDKFDYMGLLKFIARLRKYRFDLAVVPSTVSFSRTSHIIAYFSGAKYKAGVNSADGKKNKSGFLLNIKNDFYWDDEFLHQTRRFLDFGKLIGADLTKNEIESVILRLNKDELKFAEDYLIRNFGTQYHNIVGFHPGAGKSQNIWSVNKFAYVIGKLYKDYSMQILITAGKYDKEIIIQLCSLLKKWDLPCKVLQRENIRNVTAILSKIKLYVTNDTGTMHVAAYVNTPVLALFGPTEPELWCPLKSNCHNIKSPTKKINDIDENIVLAKSLELINPA